MPRLDTATQAARRDHILDAAEACFVKAGFHRTSIQDICREAGVSAGALYIYFASKEDLIAGLCTREQEAFAADLEQAVDAPDLVAAIGALAEAHCIVSHEKSRLRVEMTAEALRNPAIKAIVDQMDAFVEARLAALLERAAAQGRIDPLMPVPALVRLMSLVADGLLCQQALNVRFDQAGVMSVVRQMLIAIVRPTGSTP